MNSNVSSIDSGQSPDAVARKWIVRIDAGPLEADEREQLNRWLALDPSHAALLDTHALLWSAASKAAFPKDVPERLSVRDSAVRRRWAFPLAAAASIAAVLAIWIGVPRVTGRAAGQETFSTAVGEHRSIALVDGSSVSLDTASIVDVAYAPRTRTVRLEHGQGYFSVAKDRARPFEVVVGKTIVRAVGTRFTVRRLANDQVEVVVFEGVVELIQPQGLQRLLHPARWLEAPSPVRLAVGDMATEQDEKLILRSLPEAQLEHRLAWQNDRIVFENTPLGDAVDQVNRYSALPLILTDASLRDLRISGSFSTHDIPVFMRSLELGFGLRVKQGGRGFEISRANN